MIKPDENKRNYELAQEKYRMIDLLVYAVNMIQPWTDADTDEATLRQVMRDMVALVSHRAEGYGLSITVRDMTGISEDTQRWINATYLGEPWNYIVREDQ